MEAFTTATPLPKRRSAMFASLATEPSSKTAAPAGPSIAASKKPFETIRELTKLCKASPGGEARHLAAALKKRDPLARKILTETAEDLAFGLSHVVHLEHDNVCPVYEALCRALEGPDRQAIFVDDDSQDGTPEAICRRV